MLIEIYGSCALSHSDAYNDISAKKSKSNLKDSNVPLKDYDFFFYVIDSFSFDDFCSMGNDLLSMKPDIFLELRLSKLKVYIHAKYNKRLFKSDRLKYIPVEVEDKYKIIIRELYDDAVNSSLNREVLSDEDDEEEFDLLNIIRSLSEDAKVIPVPLEIHLNGGDK